MAFKTYISFSEWITANPVMNWSSRVYDAMKIAVPPDNTLFFFISDGVLSDNGGGTPPDDTTSIQLSSQTLTFSTTETGMLSAVQTVTITNNGTLPVTITDISSVDGFYLTKG